MKYCLRQYFMYATSAGIYAVGVSKLVESDVTKHSVLIYMVLLIWRDKLNDQRMITILFCKTFTLPELFLNLTFQQKLIFPPISDKFIALKIFFLIART